MGHSETGPWGEFTHSVEPQHAHDAEQFMQAAEHLAHILMNDNLGLNIEISDRTEIAIHAADKPTGNPIVDEVNARVAQEGEEASASVSQVGIFIYAHILEEVLKYTAMFAHLAGGYSGINSNDYGPETGIAPSYHEPTVVPTPKGVDVVDSRHYVFWRMTE